MATLTGSTPATDVTLSGTAHYIAGSDDGHYKFTGDERDAESQLDSTWFRQYSSSLGRWATPDPVDFTAADPTNPRSWNRYAYVMNNPVALVDPTGLVCNGASRWIHLPMVREYSLQKTAERTEERGSAA